MLTRIKPYNSIYEQIFVAKIGEMIIIRLANEFCECDNFEDAQCIIEQIAGENRANEQ